MLFAIKIRDDLEKLEEIASLQNKAEDLRSQDKLVKQNFHEDMKNLFELFTDTIKDTS